VHVSVPALLLTYTAGMAASSLTALPGGVGVVEAALIVGLTTAGAPLAAALGAVLVYRVLSLGGVVVIGWGVLAVHRLRTRPAITATAGRTPIRCSVAFRRPGPGCPAARPWTAAPGAATADPRRCVDRQPAATSALYLHHKPDARSHERDGPIPSDRRRLAQPGSPYFPRFDVLNTYLG